MDYAMNFTVPRSFHLLAFPYSEENHNVILMGFLLMYLLAVFWKCLVSNLHTPMYFFLCNLAFQDIISVSAFLPKLMAITMTGVTSISFLGCITQLFLFITCTDGDFLLLAIMAYDQYVAICIPLRYHLIMNSRCCILLVTIFMDFMLLDINHIFCETISMLKLSCSDTAHIQTLIAVEAPLIGILPLVHETKNSQEIDKLLTLMYLGFIPLLNPLANSLRNRQVQSAVKIVFTKYIINASCKGSLT
ncbi:hypothetical protein XELAEV_18018844mg [Xenopus laevis]|uniref:G-protein coupled receptors family 1 profile domain-containing protein n=1 Tax=Xenopus laevis TaxID=8355 RepID=A0A974DG23_XENLA|nr:hypothetical protein XELAEV_18018844mg [Xenopus laevis]